MNRIIRIYRSGKLLSTTTAEDGTSLLDCVTAAGHFLDAPCGGNGRCGKCLVKLSPAGEDVKSCRTYVEGDTDIYLPEEMDMKIAESGEGAHDAATEYEGPLGVAIDIGTTTVVAHLTDIPTKKRLATASGVNAQRPFGADVISRIQYSAENGHGELTRLIRGQIADLIRQLQKKTGVKAEEIKLVSIAGNTIMEHFYADLSPVGMGVAPFKPESLFGDCMAAGDDMPVAGDALVYLAPAVASYVGGDITAGMLACDLESDQGPTVYLDIGTNGEIAMKVGDQYYCCATAAGPAFEGAEISKGMAAVSGAINHCEWTENGLKYEVIGDCAPKGLCGSGLIDGLALMLTIGAVDETGRLLTPDEAEDDVAPYLGKADGRNAFFFSREDNVYINDEDVRKLQLAKAAIAAGIATLMHHAGSNEASCFLLAGGFGSYLNQVSAARIGLFPKSFLPVAKTMGNTAGEGAAIALCSEDARATLAAMRERCNYIELSESAYFMDQYIDQMMFMDQEEYDNA